MRIAILTQPLRYNYGGILQNFALQTVLLRMGNKVVTLDPRRNNYTLSQHAAFILRHFCGKYIKRHKQTKILEEWNRDKQIRVMGKYTFPFIDKHINRKKITDLRKDIKQDEFDAFIVGSDQVWRPEYNPNLPNMFLDFTRGWNVKRMAYAASFGVDTWSADMEITNQCRECICKFDAVTVREKNGVDMCMQLFGIRAQWVLDPTLLLSKEDYITLFKMDTINTSLGSLYVYILDENDENKKLVSDLAIRYNMIPYSYNSKALDWKNKHTLQEKIQPPVELWCKGFDQAKCVITDSFHACVFSVIFKKQFYVYGNIDRGMARYTSLFNMLGINNRFITNIADIDGIDDIDYNTVSINLNALRKMSINSITNMLEGYRNDNS